MPSEQLGVLVLARDRVQSPQAGSVPVVISKETAPPWTMTDAQEVLEPLAAWVRDRGFVLTLCGSVLLEGRGRDLDIICVPTSSACDGHELLDDLPAVFGWEVVEPNTRQSGFLSGVYVDDHRRLIDFTALTATRAG
jgi:hypothetical protein